MNQRLRITLSVVLLAAFALFNVGVPVVQYLCPMMSSDNPMCTMMPSGDSQQAAFTNVIPSCCSKYIVAERNTTPFLKIQDAASHADGVVLTPSLDLVEAIASHQPFASPHTGAFSPPSPLFILHSSLLI